MGLERAEGREAQYPQLTGEGEGGGERKPIRFRIVGQQEYECGEEREV
jgi:hypothetical protein